MAKKLDIKRTPVKPGEPRIERQSNRDPNHKLWIWMQDHHKTDHDVVAALAEKGVTVSTRSVIRWMTEARETGVHTAQAIYDITDGYVGLMDWPTPYTRKKKLALRRAMHAGQSGARSKERRTKPTKRKPSARI